MKKYVIAFLCLAGLAMAQGYTQWQEGAMQGLEYGFRLGQAYADAKDGINITGFNAEVDRYNAWVRQNFGETSNMEMQKMTTPTDLSKPVLIANKTASSGVVHEIDGGVAAGPAYTTNDVNLLPSGTIQRYMKTEEGRTQGAEYLGGV